MPPNVRIAVVGLGGVFPGAPTPASFWDLIRGGKSIAGPAPPGRWLLEAADAVGPPTPAPDRVISSRACFVEGFRLDPEGLSLDPEILARLDPMFHLALHAARQALRDARLDGVDRRRVGIALAGIALPTDTASTLADELLGRRFADLAGHGGEPAPDSGHPLNRYVSGLPAGLVAHALELGGGALTLDAACASSLYAVKLAMDELAAGRMDAMLAGGVSRPDSLYTQMGFSQLRALSPTGVCAPFDARGNGLVVGEGAGVVVLKRLEDAIAHGDRIRAVLCGVGLSNDVGGSLMSPDSEGQVRAMRAAYDRAGWRPRDVDLVECHGTGTPVGDATEVESLRRLWAEGSGAATDGSFTEPAGRCVLGSVKSNVGHLLTGAGAAGLIKVILALQEETLPPTANFERPAAALRLEAGPFEVLAAPRRWDRRKDGVPRRAAVSGFGFGGINAHLLLEEWGGIADAPGARPPSAAPDARPEPAFVTTSRPAVAVVGLGAWVGPWRDVAELRRRLLGSGDAAAGEPLEGWGGPLPQERGLPIAELSVAAARFRIPPRELEEMLPQQVLMLQVAAAAWDEARADRIDRLRTGIFCGIELDPHTTNYHLRWALLPAARRWARARGAHPAPEAADSWATALREAAHPALTANRVMGNLGGLVASRVARAFQVGGPSFTVSSLESSGPSALTLAVRALQQGELDQALAGAVDFTTDERALHALRETGATAPAADGAAAIMLKRWEDARRDGDRIYAVIRGLGTATAADAPAEALRRAHADAGIPAEAVSYVETTSSGREERDTEDARATLELYGPGNRPCAWSSTVPDVGHVGAATGLVSIVKACLALHHELLPPARDGGGAPRECGRLFRPRESQYWLRDREDGSRTAAVLSRGFDGNAVAILLNGIDREEASDWEPSPLGPAPEALFSVTADDPEGIARGARELRDRLRASTLPIHRLAREWRRDRAGNSAAALALAVVGRERQEAAESLEAALAALADSPERLAALGRAPAARIFHAPRPIGKAAPAPIVALVFPGSGNHYPGMGRDLFARWPHVLRRQDRENGRLAAQFAQGRFWSEAGWPAQGPDHRDMIFAQVSLGTMLSDLLSGLGIVPGAVLGYSLGETAGLFATRTWSDRDGMLARMQATPLFTSELAGPCRSARQAWGLSADTPVEWILGVVDRPAAEVRAALSGRSRAYLLIINTPAECVVGGDARAVAGLVSALGCAFHPLHGVTTVHCEVARPVEKAYRDLHLFDTRPPRGIRFYSGAWGRAYEPTRDACADSILHQALHTLDFTRAVLQAYEDGVQVFLEVGPGSSCTRMISRILEGRPHVARALCIPNQEGAASVLRLAAHWIAERLPIDPSPLFTEADPSELPVPSNLLRVPTRRPTPSFPPLSTRAAASREGIPAPDAPRHAPVHATPVPPPPPRLAPAAAREEIASAEPSAVPRESSALPPSPLSSPLAGALAGTAEAGRIRAEAHEAFLRVSQATSAGLSRALEAQVALLHEIARRAPDGHEPPPQAAGDRPALPTWTQTDPPRSLDRAACLEFAVGSIERVLGPRFAGIDAHPTRVRLPDEPLMLVDRILAIEGDPLSLESGRVVTEHDVRSGGWYLDGGRIPTCIAVESGQADLFLSGYLGIDGKTGGVAVYRLLDAVVTFHDSLPPPGKTIRYDIRIDRFFRQGDTYLFRFRFEGTVDGTPLLTMRDGCAGFFTAAQLAEGKGIVHTALDRRPMPGRKPDDWRPLAPLTPGSLSAAQVDSLRHGDLEAAFGPEFRGLRLAEPLRLPGGTMTLVHRVESLEPDGGRFGLGRIRGVADVHPDDWYLTCHFVDDRVMPGTLMYECCLHTLRIYLQRMGWITEAAGSRYEPVPGVASGLKCRGQVIETTRMATYEVSIKELGYAPEPYVIADALMYADGKPIVEITNLSLRMAGTTRADVEFPWTTRVPGSVMPAAPAGRVATASPAGPGAAAGARGGRGGPGAGGGGGWGGGGGAQSRPVRVRRRAADPRQRGRRPRRVRRMARPGNRVNGGTRSRLPPPSTRDRARRGSTRTRSSPSRSESRRRRSATDTAPSTTGASSPVCRVPPTCFWIAWWRSATASPGSFRPEG